MTASGHVEAMAGPLSPVVLRDGRGAYGTRRDGLASTLLSEKDTKAHLAELGQVRVGMAPPKRKSSEDRVPRRKKLKPQKNGASLKRRASEEDASEEDSNSPEKLKAQKGEAAPSLPITVR
jgi:hypothetical protein